MTTYQVDIRPDNYPQQSIVPLNEFGQKNGEEKAYQYREYCPVNIINNESLHISDHWKLIATRSYTDGNDNGIYKFFFEEEFTDNKGCCYFMIKSEKRIIYESDHESVHSLFRNGHLIETIPHINDVPDGLCTFYSRPDIHMDNPMYKWYEEYTYNNGIKEGPANCYKPDGTLYKSYTYVDGKKHGEYKKFYPSGRLMLIRYLDQDERCGTETCYYESGAIHWTVDYDHDVPGTKLTYRENGTLQETEEMDNKYYWCPRHVTTTYYKADGITVDRVFKTYMTGKYDYGKGQHHSTLLEHLETLPVMIARSVIITA